MDKTKINFRSREGGYVLLTMGVTAFALFGVMGMAVDLGRMFIIKNETQAYCDSAALAAALDLDGTSQGITNAINDALAVGNKYNFDTSSLTTQCSSTNQITTNCVTIDFATSQNGTYSTNPGSPSGYIYARVQTTVNASLYFMPALQVKFTSSPNYSQTVNAIAIAGQIDFGSTPINEGAMPYTAVTVNPGSADFGFTVGQLYDMQWPQYNSTRNKCGQGLAHVSDCFNSPPCAGDLASNTVMDQVVHNWGSSTNGYWGFNSNSLIAGTVLGVNQEVPIFVGENLMSAPYTTPNCNSEPCNVMTNGNKAAESQVLDSKASEDVDMVLSGSNNGTGNGGCSQACWNNVDGSTTITDYTSSDSPLGNGLRTFLVPVVYPGCDTYSSTTHTCTGTGGTSCTTCTAVVGYAKFLLYAKGTSGNSTWYKDNTQGNDPYCAIYMGPWNGPGSNNGGGGGSGSSGAYRVKLVY